MFWSNVFETVMLLCFAAAWPASIYKSWVSRTRKGKSLAFMLIVLVGYMAGITKVLVSHTAIYMLIPYTVNTTLVACDIVLYYRNYRIDEGMPHILTLLFERRHVVFLPPFLQPATFETQILFLSRTSAFFKKLLNFIVISLVTIEIKLYTF